MYWAWSIHKAGCNKVDGWGLPFFFPLMERKTNQTDDDGKKETNSKFKSGQLPKTKAHAALSFRIDS